VRVVEVATEVVVTCLTEVAVVLLAPPLAPPAWEVDVVAGAIEVDVVEEAIGVDVVVARLDPVVLDVAGTVVEVGAVEDELFLTGRVGEDPQAAVRALTAARQVTRLIATQLIPYFFATE
jgi:hypothetical protein